MVKYGLSRTSRVDLRSTLRYCRVCGQPFKNLGAHATLAGHPQRALPVELRTRAEKRRADWIAAMSAGQVAAHARRKRDRLTDGQRSR